MYKIDSIMLLEFKDLIDRADKAINVLERNNKNKIVYPELKKDLQKMSEKLESRFTLSEFSDINKRNRELDKNKVESGQ